MGIEKALEILLMHPRPNLDAAIRSWMERPSSALLFGCRPPKDLLITGRSSDLYRLRSYLDGWRGEDFG